MNINNLELLDGYEMFDYMGHKYIRNKEKSILLDLTNIYKPGCEPSLVKMVELFKHINQTNESIQELYEADI